MLIVFLFPLAYSPGPGNMFFAATGARFGIIPTLPASAGYHVATWIVTYAIGTGLLTIVDTAPLVTSVMQVLGALYVLWIAYSFVRADATMEHVDTKSVRFWDGVVLMILNPKAYAIIAMMFSQFLPQNDNRTVLGTAAITTIFTVNNLVAFTLWTLLGDRLAILFDSPQRAAILNNAFGFILAGVALWMLFW